MTRTTDRGWDCARRMLSTTSAAVIVAHFSGLGPGIEALDGDTGRFEPVETFLEDLEGAIE